ncbi:aconitase X [Chloroflexota bacterium]
MRLTKEENEMVGGKFGYPVQKAMEILVGLGACFDAQRMLPVKSVHLAVNSAVGAGDEGIAFVESLALQGGKFVTFTDTNPVTTPYEDWREIGISEEWAGKQDRLTDSYAKMGAFLGNTCTPYIIGQVPMMGEHIAWSESSATIFANAVIGARTNREGGPSSLASALTGRTPEYGFHLDRNRYGDIEILVTAPLSGLGDYGALGYFAGRIAQDRVPVFTGMPEQVTWNELKMLCAAAATSGSIAMFHAVDITPEAPTREFAFGPNKSHDTFEFGDRELEETAALITNATKSEVDLVILGCPHYTIDEIGYVASLIEGKKLKKEMWILTAQVIKNYAERMGYLDIIEKSGGKILGDACQNLMPPGFFNGHGYYTFATNSPKLAFYQKGLQNVLSHFGATDKCVQAALSGVWR